MPPLYIGVIMDPLRSVGISHVFREALYSSWRGWDRLLLHCLRSIARNSSGPPEEFCEIIFIASMMSSLVILKPDSVFPCGCPKKPSGPNSHRWVQDAEDVILLFIQ